MLAMIAVPAAITLKTVRSPAKLEMINSDPTPHGYTWCLLLFLVPIVTASSWILKKAVPDLVSVPSATMKSVSPFARCSAQRDLRAVSLGE
jgi:hypothetical protein